MNVARSRVILAFAVLVAAAGAAFAAEVPDAISSPGTVVLRAHAVGAQIYECKAGNGGQTVWQFREPIASLFVDGKTVGRHFAGPSWEIQGSTIVGKASGKAPGATNKDVAWLKLDVTEHHGDGPLNGVSVVQRLNTSGGNLDGSCDKEGDLRAEPYAADYVFLKPQ